MQKKDRINSTEHNGLVVAGVALLVVAGIVPAAQGGSMGNGHQQRIQAVVNRCVAMPHDQMMKDQGCTSTMAQHPEMFPGGSAPPKNTPPH